MVTCMHLHMLLLIKDRIEFSVANCAIAHVRLDKIYRHGHSSMSQAIMLFQCGRIRIKLWAKLTLELFCITCNCGKSIFINEFQYQKSRTRMKLNMLFWNNRTLKHTHANRTFKCHLRFHYNHTLPGDTNVCALSEQHFTVFTVVKLEVLLQRCSICEFSKA